MVKLAGLIIIDAQTLPSVYGSQQLAAIEQHVHWVGAPQTRTSIRANKRLLAKAEVIFSGWTPPAFDDAFLDSAPNLQAIFYAAGPLDATAAAERGIVVTTAHHANSKPVAEFTLATIILSLKHGWRLAREVRENRRYSVTDRDNVPGCFGTTVGLIGLGLISRILLPMLRPFDLKVVAYDPYVSAAEAAMLGVQLMSLGDLFAQSDVVSVHSPLNAATRGMIGAEHFDRMRQGATFINTARGGVVREADLIATATLRKDLQFVLDVTDPVEPPVAESPLYTLPNVVLTPHLAGSAGGECQRLGQYMVEELQRFASGERLEWAITPQPRCDVVRIPFATPAGVDHPIVPPLPALNATVRAMA